MTVELAPDLQVLMDELLATGEFESEEKVIRAALRDLAQRRRDLAAIRAGVADIEAGRSMSVDESERRIRERFGFGDGS